MDELKEMTAEQVLRRAADKAPLDGYTLPITKLSVLCDTHDPEGSTIYDMQARAFRALAEKVHEEVERCAAKCDAKVSNRFLQVTRKNGKHPEQWLVDVGTVSRVHLDTQLVVFDDGGAMNLTEESIDKLVSMLMGREALHG